MGEYSFMTEPDYWDEADTEYLEVFEETWQLIGIKTLKYGRTATWCKVCDEEFVLPEPAPEPHFCPDHSDSLDGAGTLES